MVGCFIFSVTSTRTVCISPRLHSIHKMPRHNKSPSLEFGPLHEDFWNVFFFKEKDQMWGRSLGNDREQKNMISRLKNYDLKPIINLVTALRNLDLSQTHVKFGAP